MDQVEPTLDVKNSEFLSQSQLMNDLDYRGYQRLAKKEMWANRILMAPFYLVVLSVVLSLVWRTLNHSDGMDYTHYYDIPQVPLTPLMALTGIMVTIAIVGWVVNNVYKESLNQVKDHFSQLSKVIIDANQDVDLSNNIPSSAYVFKKIGLLPRYCIGGVGFMAYVILMWLILMLLNGFNSQLSTLVEDGHLESVKQAIDERFENKAQQAYMVSQVRYYLVKTGTTGNQLNKKEFIDSLNGWAIKDKHGIYRADYNVLPVNFAYKNLKVMLALANNPS